MTAKQDLIAAALTVRDVMQRGSVPEVYSAVKDLRELCARAMVQPVSESWRYCDTHGTGSEYAWGCPECVREMRAEIARLVSCLRYEQHRAERIGTHGPHCKNWGPAHYECAMSALTAAEARADETRRLYNELLHQVGMKYPGETRHETAIRYLRLAEIHVCGPADAALRGEVKP